MELCSKCLKRETCVELCPKAERYVNQDHVKMRELVSSNIVDMALDREDEELIHIEIASYLSCGDVNFECCTSLENRILKMFYIDKFTHKQIAHRLSNQHRRLLSTAVKQRLKRVRVKLRHFFSIYR